MPLAEELHGRLSAEGHHVFLDTKMPLGTDWAAEIPKQIDECDFFIVLLGAMAAAHSDMVQEEVRQADDDNKL